MVGGRKEKGDRAMPTIEEFDDDATAEAKLARAKRLVEAANPLLQAEDWEAAAEALGAAIALAEEPAVAWRVNLANCLCELPGREAEAEAQYKAAQASSPASFEVMANYSLFLSERGAAREVEALCKYKLAVKLNPGWAQGQFNLGNLLDSLGAEHEAEALGCYKAACQYGPREADYHNNYALCLANSGDLPLAMRHSQAATTLAPARADLCLNFAELLGASGEVNMAIKVAAEAAHNSKGQPAAEAAAYALLGSLLQSVGDDARALPALAQAWQRSYAQAQTQQAADTMSVLPTSVLEQRYKHGLRYASSLAGTQEGGAAAAAVYKQLATLSAAQSSALRFKLDAAQGAEDGVSWESLSASLRDEALFSTLMGDSAAATKVHQAAADALSKSQHKNGELLGASAGCLGCIAGLQLSSPVELCSKSALARNLAAAGLEACAPPTTLITTYEELAKVVITAAAGPAGNGGKPLWYLKDPHVQVRLAFTSCAFACVAAILLARALCRRI